MLVRSLTVDCVAQSSHIVCTRGVARTRFDHDCNDPPAARGEGQRNRARATANQLVRSPFVRRSRTSPSRVCTTHIAADGERGAQGATVVEWPLDEASSYGGASKWCRRRSFVQFVWPATSVCLSVCCRCSCELTTVCWFFAARDRRDTVRAANMTTKRREVKRREHNGGADGQTSGFGREREVSDEGFLFACENR